LGKVYIYFLPITEQKEVDAKSYIYFLEIKKFHFKADFETRKMTHFLLTDNTKIKKNEYNIPEPVDGIEVPLK
jgi:5-formyltetrahydrofolate cyclo-ligase